MNRADKIFIGIVFICSILLYIPLIVSDLRDADKVKEAVVHYKDEEILRIDMNKNKRYRVDGTLGKVEIEVKDQAVRVEKENSPNNLCSIQGWVDTTNRPIICLPNNIVVQIEAKEESVNGDDTVIQ